MQFLALLLLVVGALADHAFQPGKEYVYKHAAEVSAAYPGAAPLAPGALTANVKLVAATPNRIVAYMEGVNVDATGARAHASEYAKWLETPFAINAKGGVVKSVEVSPRVPAWAVNIIKAKVSVLNLNLAGVELYKAAPVLRTAEPNSAKTFYRVYEETHYGLCEVSYTISPLPTHLATCVESAAPCVEVPEEVRGAVAEHMVVTKAVDYHKCKAPATLAHVMPPVANVAPYAPMVNALYSRVTLTQYVIKGDRTNFLVKSINHVEKVALNPLGGETEKVLLETKSRWTLVAVKAAAAAPRLPFTPKVVPSVVSEIGALVKAAAAGVTEAPYKKLLPIHASTATIVGKAVALLTEMAEDVEGEAYAAPEKAAISSKFLAVVDAVRFLDLPELVQVYERIAAAGAGAKAVTMRAFFLDACAMCGNNPCVALIKKLVVERKVSAERAAVIIMTLPMTIKTPTPAVIAELVELAAALKTESATLYATTLVAVSNVVYHHCVKPAYVKPARDMYAPTTGIEFCGVATPAVERFVNLCATELRVAKATAVKVAVVRALANTAHPKALEILKPIVAGAGAPEFVRVAAVASLHRAAECHKEAVCDILMGVFGNLAEPIAVRIAAAAVVIGAAPTHENLVKVALATWYEPSVQVHAYAYTAFRTLAAAGLPVSPVVNLAAKTALALCKPLPAVLPFSIHAVYADYIPTFNVGAVAALSAIGSHTSFIPKVIQAALIQHEGYPHKAAEFAVVAEGLEELIRTAAGPASLEQIKSVLSAISPRGPRSNVSSKQIHEEFKLKEAAAVPKVAAWIRIADAIEGVVALGGEGGVGVNAIIAEVLAAVDALKAGVAVNIQKSVPLVDAMVILPTEVGYPVEVRIACPVTVSIRGNVKAAIGEPTVVEAALKPIVSAEYQAKVTVFGFPTETIAQAGTIARVQVGAPVAFAARINPATHEAEFKVAPHAAAAAVVGAHVLVAPYVAYEPFAAVGTPVVHFKSFKPVTRGTVVRKAAPCAFSKNVLGLNVEYEHATDAPAELGPIVGAFVWKHIAAPLSVFNFPYYAVGPALNYNKFNVVVRPAASATKEVKVVVRYFANKAEEVKEETRSYLADSTPSTWESSKRMTLSDISAKSMRSTKITIQTKEAGVSVEGAAAHNVEVVVATVGEAPRVYKNVISVVAAPGAPFRLAHVKYVFGCGAIPVIAPEPYQVVVEGSAAKVGDAIHCKVAGHYGPAAGLPKKIVAGLKLDKTDELRRSEPTRKALNHMKLRIEHAAGYIPATVHKVVRGVENVLTYALYPYMTTEVGAARVAGRIEVEAACHPAARVCDIVLVKEAEKCVFAGIPVPKALANIVPVPASREGLEKVLRKVSGGLVKPVCKVAGGAVVTFDGARIPVSHIPMNKAVLLAKYIGSAESAAVLLKRTTAGEVVTVALGARVIAVAPCASCAGGYKVIVDGAAAAVAAGKPVVIRAGGAVVAKIEAAPGGGVACVCPVHGIAVVVAPGAIAVEATPLFRGRMTGVCGNYNGEKSDEVEVAEKKIKESRKEMKVDEFDTFFKKSDNVYIPGRSAPKYRDVKVEEPKYMMEFSKKIEKFISKFTKDE